MASKTRSYISMMPSDDDDDEMFTTTKRPRRRCCCCIYVIVVVVAVLVIIGLAVGLGITAHKLNSSNSEATASVDCGGLPDPTNGTVVLTGTVLGSQATYSCDPNLTLAGDSVRFCVMDGWSGEEPTCEPIDCGVLADPENGEVDVSNGTSLGASAVYSCDSEYLLMGARVRVCQENSSWSGDEPFCQPIDCGVLADPENGEVDVSNGTSLGASAVYSCDSGYLLMGTRVRVCQENNSWSGDVPFCQPIDCGVLADPENGEVDLPSGTSLGALAVYSCDSGYLLMGARVRVCQENSSWSGDEPFCQSSGRDVCDTDSCAELSTLVKKKMDTSISPCEDFYNYTCGMFDAAAAKGGPTRAFQALYVRNYQGLSNILSDAAFDTENVDALMKLKVFFDSCMNTEEINHRGVQPLLELLNKTGRWPVLDDAGSGSRESDWDINGDEFLAEKLLGSPAFYSLTIQPDRKDSTKPLLYLSQSGLTLGYVSFYTEPLWTLLTRSLLINTINSTLVRLNPDGDLDLYNQTATEIAEFEHSLAQPNERLMDIEAVNSYHVQPKVLGLCQTMLVAPQISLTLVEQRDLNSTYNVLALSELSELWPEYNWVSAISRLFATENITVGPTEPVSVASLSYFKNLSAVNSSVASPRTIENYAKWQFVHSFVGYLDEDTQAVHEDLRRKTLQTGLDAGSRGVFCVLRAEAVLPLALARPFVEKLLPAENPDSAGEMGNNLETAMKQRMNTLDWMDEYTRQRSKEKVDAITSKIAYPAVILDDVFMNTVYGMYVFTEADFFGNVLQCYKNIMASKLISLRQPVDRAEYNGAPTVINAKYYAPFNQITILAGIMNTPVFQTDWPAAFRLGALGTIVGHEITHGFDSRGRQFDAQGNLQQWWSQEAVQNYVDRQQCFVDQYSGYSKFGFHVNGELTLGENIADNGGIKASYQAFKNTGSTQTLSGLPLTADQLFFVAWAQQWCAYYSPTEFYVTTLTDVHSPGPFRVIGPLVNNADFASAFNCRVGSPMNPKDKCLLW